MKRYRLAALCGVLVLAAVSSGCNKLKARDQLNKGVNAYRNAQFQAAIDHFQQAVSLDPTYVNARLYLAMSYFQQYVPGGDSADNLKAGKQAIDAFGDVLKMDPQNATALATIGLIYYNMKDFDKAKEFQQKRTEAEPNNPEPYYWIGVINWAVCYKNNADARAGDSKLSTPNAQGDLPPLPEKIRADLSAKNSALVDDGIKALEKAVDLRPNYDDAMTYLNLLLRQKADLEADSDARAADFKSAEDWQQKAIQARKTLAAQTPAGGITQ
ncbi:MAG TPA: tetratricopeptide repeat protein [Terriglobia bacterium]|nr:tetratricopeptide repeat protein [Terriglobia bacterium]